MDTASTTPPTSLVGPGWLQLMEHLHQETEEMRNLLRDAMAHGTRLLSIMEADRQEIDRLRRLTPAPALAPPERRPAPAPPDGASWSSQVLALLAHHPDGMSARAIAAALGTSKRLHDTLRGMARRGHVVHRASGLYALPVGTLEPVGLNGVGVGP